MYKIKITPGARLDTREAALWYNEQRPGLGKRFTNFVKGKLELISKNPYLYEVRYSNIRLAQLPIFPFSIHFRIDEISKTVVIFAVFHMSLNPDKWPFRKE
ncbi:type II toxin-antitoxin system RelE/ParE family toxin [Dyadobacter aurulentus]|uniref:type II toxin-antitoxin system RelE/ParE family toxin n=1 Tax=Dyadobacter sp. UC 10 TaxID=2605428 RepID=UPI0011F0A049|nr:type II toxin-antitoxin system RelE/ParE family toxin [Dyadobacter sp. UC 10]